MNEVENPAKAKSLRALAVNDRRSLLLWSVAVVAAAAILIYIATRQTPHPTTKPAAPSPVNDTTIDQFLRDQGVALVLQTPNDPAALRVVERIPPGWSAVQSPDTYLVLTGQSEIDPDFTPNGIVLVYKLAGSFDPRGAVLRGLTDTQRLPSFHQTNASLNDFQGQPSSAIEGSYTYNDDKQLRISHRNVIAQTPAGRYLVQLIVTTTVAQANVLAADIKDITNGLDITT
ncbi:MAG: LpqN/LpqT family lipoprotein [Segniliparus sp.]|uniref:LpqN/LpqT family lipoprotein n=1 Tax=Segniliparus sp. TaxID=2804064 RepID=UPI003F2C374E